MLVNRLNKRVQLFGKVKEKNELGQVEYSYKLLKILWADIVPISGREADYLAETTISECRFKFILRENSIKNINRDMYFIYKNKKYYIEYFTPNFKYLDRIEVFCKVVEE